MLNRPLPSSLIRSVATASNIYLATRAINLFIEPCSQTIYNINWPA